MHGGILHLGLNMYALVLIGPPVEKHFGKAIYIALFLGAGLAGTTVANIAEPYQHIPSMGASGAIMGLFGVGTALGDKLSKEILYSQVIIFIIAVPLVQNGIQVPLITNISYFAHFGGFAFGYFLTTFGMRKKVKKYLKRNAEKMAIGLSIYK
jgi:membrane associated rhomboid family serine protease